MDEGGNTVKKEKLFVVGGLILFLLFTSVPSASAVGPKGVSEALVIRADRIESKGMLLGLGSGNHGLVLKLKIGESKISGMRMEGSYLNGSGRWEVSVQDSGSVAIHGLSVDASAIGFKIKAGDFIHFDKPLQINSMVPSIVLHDVYLRVERMEAEEAGMHSLDLDTTKEVSLAPPKGGIFIDLRSFSSLSQPEAEEKINGILSDDLEKVKEEEDPSKDKEDPGKDGDKEDGEEEDSDKPEEDAPPDGEDPKGEEPSQPGTDPPTNPIPGEGVPEKTVELDRYFTALEIVNEAKKYKSKITLKQGKKEYQAKDWGQMVLMKRLSGTEVTIIAEGSDGKTAVKGMAEFLGKE